MNIKPSLWLLVAIVGLPQLSETVYAPSLSLIAGLLSISESVAEYTFTIYLIGFSLGTFFWGLLSDKKGRKPCIIAGFSIYILGCLICYESTAISLLMIGRFIQACGASVGSVLGQAIVRDVFIGDDKGKIYSTIGSVLAFSPSVGPIIGSIVAEWAGWNTIFLLLSFMGLIIATISFFQLHETRSLSEKNEPLLSIAYSLFSNKKIWISALIVGICNGINFSYYAEGSFYLMKILGLTSLQYGLSFIFLAFAGATGGILSRLFIGKKSPYKIMKYGSWGVLLSTFFFTLISFIFYFLKVGKSAFIFLALLSMMIIIGSIGMIIPNVLSIALENYKSSIGTASSLFGCLYYALISLITFGMGMCHSGTLFSMPIYFFALSVILYYIMRNFEQL